MTTAQVIPFPTPHDREGRQANAERPRRRRSAASPERRRSVSNKAFDWVWTVPVRGTRQHVLLALAKKARPKTEVATPSMPELAEMTGLTENTIRTHIKALVTMRLVRVEQSNGGRHKRSRYTLMVDTAAADCGSPTPQEVRGSEGGETPQQMHPATPQEVRGEAGETPQLTERNPSADAPVVLRTKGGTRGRTTAAAVASAEHGDGLFAVESAREPKPVAPAVRETSNKIAQRLAKAHYDRNPLVSFVGVMKLCKRALDANYAEADIAAALARLDESNRVVTANSLRIELDGPPLRAASGGYDGPYQNPPLSAYDDRGPWGQK